MIVKAFLKQLAAQLPSYWRQVLKRHLFARRIRQGRFGADEVEFELLHEFLKPGDWAIDIGANIGNYTIGMSDLVGSEGRVLAFEPVPETFELLASNCALAQWKNVSLFNAAVSENHSLVAMDVPITAATGLANYYRAQVSESGALRVLTVPIDALQLSHKIRLVKVDAEGHEFSVLKGMRELIARDSPSIIIEGDDHEVELFLYTLGYEFKQLPGSWNRIYETRSG